MILENGCASSFACTVAVLRSHVACPSVPLPFHRVTAPAHTWGSTRGAHRGLALPRDEQEEEAEHHGPDPFALPKHVPVPQPCEAWRRLPQRPQQPAVCAHTCPRSSPITQVPVTLHSFASAVTTHFLSSPQSPSGTQAKAGRKQELTPSSALARQCLCPVLQRCPVRV